MKKKNPHTTRLVTFAGPLPPPVTGMTAMTAVIVEALEKEGPVKCYNWSRNKPLKGLRWKLARAWGVCKTLLGLSLRGRHKGEVLYYPVNSSWGLLYDMALAALGRTLGYRIVLHHHAYSYIDRRDWRMAMVDKLIGSRGFHAVHCQKMVEDYRAQYQTQATFLIVPPTIVSCEPKKQSRQLPKAIEEVFTLGFLSNLTLAKGLEVLLDTFENLVNRGLPVRLVLAGPCMQQDARLLIEQATMRWPDLVEYRGPVYDDQKTQFYTEIDVFLFPTQYKNESWGIVLTEALAAGRPVIAYDRGCISYIVRDGCGLVVPKNEDFVSTATEQIKLWMADSRQFEEASLQAYQRSQVLEREAIDQLPAFVQRVRNQPPP